MTQWIPLRALDIHSHLLPTLDPLRQLAGCRHALIGEVTPLLGRDRPLRGPIAHHRHRWALIVIGELRGVDWRTDPLRLAR